MSGGGSAAAESSETKEDDEKESNGNDRQPIAVELPTRQPTRKKECVGDELSERKAFRVREVKSRGYYRQNAGSLQGGDRGTDLAEPEGHVTLELVLKDLPLTLITQRLEVSS